MPTVQITLPVFDVIHARNTVACHVEEATLLTCLAADLGFADGIEANEILWQLSKRIRAGKPVASITAGPKALARMARACREQAKGTYRDCPAIPVLLTVALGCEAASQAKAA